MQRLQPMQNPHFASKIKIPKNMSKSIRKIIQSCSVQKTAPKNTEYSRNETILKIGHQGQPLQNCSSFFYVGEIQCGCGVVFGMFLRPFFSSYTWHGGQFLRFGKNCHFSKNRCFLESFSARKNSNVVVESFFACFWEF